MPDFCKSCKAAVVWAKTEKGKPMPVDAEPVADGNILLSHRRVGEPPVAMVRNAEQQAELRAQAARRGDELRLFKSHFATCPQQREWRR